MYDQFSSEQTFQSSQGSADSVTNDLQAILARAQELENSSAQLLRQPDLAALVEAAHEAGLSKDSVVLALRERLDERQHAYRQGELVFALSDNRWYPCVCVDVVGARVHVRYLTGGENVCEPHQVRPFGLAPGQVVDAYYSKMWTKARVARFNPDSRSVTVNVWGGESVLSLEHIRLRPERPNFAQSILNTVTGKHGNAFQLSTSTKLLLVGAAVVIALILGFYMGLGFR